MVATRKEYDAKEVAGKLAKEEEKARKKAEKEAKFAAKMAAKKDIKKGWVYVCQRLTNEPRLKIFKIELMIKIVNHVFTSLTSFSYVNSQRFNIENTSLNPTLDPHRFLTGVQSVQCAKAILHVAQNDKFLKQ